MASLKLSFTFEIPAGDYNQQKVVFCLALFTQRLLVQ